MKIKARACAIATLLATVTASASELDGTFKGSPGVVNLISGISSGGTATAIRTCCERGYSESDFDGTVDVSLDVTDGLLLPNGHFVTAGSATSTGVQGIALVELKRNGGFKQTQFLSVGPGGTLSNAKLALSSSADSYFVVSRVYDRATAGLFIQVVKMKLDGTIDASFGAGGSVAIALVDSALYPTAVVTTSHGIVVAGYYQDAGKPVDAFTAYVDAAASYSFVKRYKTNPTTWGGTYIYAAAYDAVADKIVLGGGYVATDPAPHYFIMQTNNRYYDPVSADLDSSFGDPAKGYMRFNAPPGADTSVRAMAIASDQSILTLYQGYASDPQNCYKFWVPRDGHWRGSGYTTDMVKLPNDEAVSLTCQFASSSKNGILFGGSQVFAGFGGVTKIPFVYKLDSDGSRDFDFAWQGYFSEYNDTVWRDRSAVGAGILDDGRVVFGASSQPPGFATQYHFTARIQSKDLIFQDSFDG